LADQKTVDGILQSSSKSF